MNSKWLIPFLRGVLVLLGVGASLAGIYFYFKIPFHPPADVLGNAHYWNIDIDRFFRAYTLWVIWPVIAVGVYFLLLSRKAQPFVAVPTEASPSESYRLLTYLPFAFCLALLFPFRTTGLALGQQTMLLALLLTAVLFALGKRCLYLTPLCWCVLYRFSSLTGVAIPNGFVSYPWFPLVLLLGVMGIHFGWLLKKRPSLSDSVYLSSVPVLIYLLHAYLPRGLGEMDFSHDGELVSSAELLTKGFLPWRDLVLSHGFLSTQFTAWVGFQVFEKSRWGLWAGQYIVIAPVYWASLYLFSYYFFRKNRFFLLAFNLILPFAVPNLFRREFFRCVLLLPTYIVFYRFLIAPKWRWALSAAGLAILQALVTIEAGFIIPAIALAVFLYDALKGEGHAGFLHRWQRTIRLGISGFGLFALFCLGLISMGAFSGFVNTYMTWGGNFRYYSSIEPSFPSVNFAIAAFLPLGLVFLTPLWIYLRHKTGRLTARDGVMLCAYLFLVPYYQKYLNRMDQHVYHVYIVAFPLFLFYFFEGMTWLDTRVSQVKSLPQLASTVLFVWILLHPFSWADRISEIPQQFVVSENAMPEVARVGFTDSKVEKGLVADFNQFLQNYLEPNEAIFDFANQGGLLYFLLGRVPASRYYYAVNAIRRDAQREVISDLERTRPRYILFAYPRHWTARMDDVPLVVRHYELSKYIFRHYTPFGKLHERYIYRRNDLPKMAVRPPLEKLDRNSLFDFASCDWGYAAHHFSYSKGGEDDLVSEKVPFYRVNPNEVGIDLSRYPLSEVESLEFEFEKLGHNQFILSDGDSGQNHHIRFWSLPDGSPTIRLSVSSCPQWYGYTQSQLRLASAQGSSLVGVSVRLKNGSSSLSPRLSSLKR